MTFLSELTRRNVIRMAGLYLVGAWLIVQVAETLLPVFGTPEWVLKTLILLLALCFVPALVASWVFELTPDGLKREGQVASAHSNHTQTAKRLDVLTLSALALVILLFAADRFWTGKDESQPVAVAVRQPAGVSAVASSPDTKPKVPRATADSRLVAVLPFRNRSERPEDAYFAEGVHDDLLTQLSKIAALKVISRTSMMRYADTTLSIPQIAKELGAAVVLEGAVQRAGDTVRVNVQVIDGASDVHLWAENYDRALTTETIFEIQADIAQAVASALQVVLSPAENNALRAGSTKSLPAYEAFLRGKLLSAAVSISAEKSEEAIAAFDRAIALDPDFAEAYARKAQIQLLSYWLAVGPRSLREDARESVAQAERLAPDSIETRFAQAIEYYYAQLDFARADATLKSILAQVPDHAEAWEYSALVARRDGRFEDSIAAFEHALSIDPQSADAIESLFEMMAIVRGDFEAAAALLSRARALGTGRQVREIWLHEWSGDLDAAWAAVDGPVTTFIAAPARIAIASRDAKRIEYALSPAIWPEAQRGPGDFPEAYAMVKAESLLVMGRQEEADQLLAEIKSRMAQRSAPYPSRWLANAYYQPCDLPGMLGDLEGVRATEADYLKNAPRDVWGSRRTLLLLATAFARAGDPERAMHYLENLVGIFGPQSYLWISVVPGLDSVRDHPRYRALERGYQSWSKAKKGG